MLLAKLKSFFWRYLHGAKWYLLNVTGCIPSHFVRNRIYQAFGMNIGVKSVIYSGAEIRRPDWISIGDGSIIGNGAILDGRLGIDIGKNVNFSTGVWIWTVQHDYRSHNFPDVGGRVVIGDRAWLSCRVIVLPGVVIGEGAVVAAGSVVTKNVDPYSVVGGIPARKIGERPRDLDYDLSNGSPIPFI